MEIMNWQTFINFKYKYRFKGESKWEIVDMRSLRSVTLDQINE